MAIEKKSLTLTVRELEAEGTFAGVASVYSAPDLTGDVIQPGAFRDSIARKSRLPLLWMHDQPIGTIDVQETAEGIEAIGQIVLETTLGKDAYALMKAGAVDGLSVGFMIDSWRWDGANRVIEKATLLEVSLTPVPAQPAARITEVKEFSAESRPDMTPATLQVLSAQIRLIRARISN
ncbi:MAG: primosomal replication protein N [Bryobacteraceae bacterium]|nr:MAG: primosomal replication protein N [Bryobacteraceae bacterium]